MIKIYVMPTCPDCAFVMEQAKENPNFEIINIGSHVHKLKEFIHLRDHNLVFNEVKKQDKLGIPCFVMDNNQVTLNPNDVGLKPYIAPDKE